MSGGELVEASWKLAYLPGRIGVSEQGSFHTDAINLWGVGHVISPELFVRLNIAPGQSMAWRRTYEIFELA